jgi:hypothetical protein
VSLLILAYLDAEANAYYYYAAGLRPGRRSIQAAATVTARRITHNIRCPPSPAPGVADSEIYCRGY